MVTTSVSSEIANTDRPLARRNGSRPLYGKRVDFLRAYIAGEHRRAVGRNADLGVLVGSWRQAQLLQTGERFKLAIGEMNPDDLRVVTPSGVVKVLVIRRMGPIDYRPRLVAFY